MAKKKYRLMKTEKVVPLVAGWNPETTRSACRIKALRDIPEHGVKKGDLGGYVSHFETLSHEGSCWVGYDAMVIGQVNIKDDAYVGDKAIILCDFKHSKIILSDSTRVFESARIDIAKYSDMNEPPAIISRLSGNSQFFGNSQVSNLIHSSENAKIYGNTQVNGAKRISGETEIYGKSTIGRNSIISGETKIYDNAIINTGAEVTDCIVSGKAQIGKDEKVTSGKFEEEGIFVNPKKVIPKIVIGGARKGKPEHWIDAEDNPIEEDQTKNITNPKTKTEKLLELFAEIKSDLASYETDIVKIIKYPVMTDRTDARTLHMAKLLKKAERLRDDPEDPDFEATVSDLENAFLAAESNALKIASTLLSDADKKKTELAKDLLAIAGNEASPENEKKIAFNQAFKQLEGVVIVPEIAIDTFRIKVGLKEILS